MDRRHHDGVGVPDRDRVGIRGRCRELDVIAGLQIEGSDTVAARRTNRLLRQTRGAADRSGLGGAGKVLQEVSQGLVVHTRVAGRNGHQQLRPGQGGRISRILKLPFVQVDAAAVERQGQDGGQDQHRHGNEDDRLP